ncbi:MAG: hypothetical protein J7M11_01545, partial [Elusimicrobia bacterium]|nr:hypothetical protein [Elusimicrobiota bacterium]
YVIWDIKTSRSMSSGKLKNYSLQLEFYRYMLSKMENKPVEIGGIIWLKDFISRQADTKLTIAKTLNVEEPARELMEQRLKELRGCC